MDIKFVFYFGTGIYGLSKKTAILDRTVVPQGQMPLVRNNSYGI